MKQSRITSLLEVVLSTMIGFIASLLLWIWFIKPYYNIQTAFIENLEITLWFTILSILRGFGVRRLFNHFRHELETLSKRIYKLRIKH